MAEKVNRAKHAFGKSENLQNALNLGTVDAFDILFLDGDTDPKVGWVTKDGEIAVVPSVSEVKGQVAELETELASKANAEEVAAQLATKVSSEEVDAKIDTTVTEKVNTVVTEKVDAAVAEEVEEVMAEKVDTIVNEKVDTVVTEKVETLVTEKVTEQVTEKVETTVVKALAKTDKYEIVDVPDGTLVDYNDKEIRIMAPHDAVWTKQAVGEGGDANSYYCTFKTYVPNDDVAGYIEHLGDQVDEEILTTFSTDEQDRRYQPTWLALANYDESTDTWTYYGANSNEEKFVGWNYRIDWYDANGVMISSDSIRINLSNEDCHYVIEPYYVGSAVTEKVEEVVEAKVETIVETKVDTAMDEKVEGAINTAKEYTDSKIAEIENSYGIIEF